LLSLLKHWEVEEEWCYEDVVKEGVQWLMNNQREDGGRGKSRKNEDESLNLEKSCYAMMALLKYCEITGDVRPDPCIHRGLGTLINADFTLIFAVFPFALKGFYQRKSAFISVPFPIAQVGKRKQT